MAELFQVKIITPDRVLYEGQASMLEMNTADGEIGVYAKHIPLTTTIEPGIVTIHEEKEIKLAAVHSGFVVIMLDEVTLMAEIAEWPDEIDVERARASEERARKRLLEKSEKTDTVRAELSLRRALVRIEASERM